MKKITLFLINIFLEAAICLSQDIKKQDFVYSNYCGSFITLSADNKAVKEDYILEETSQTTSDGGTSIFLKISSKKSKSSENKDNSSLEEAPSNFDTTTVTSSEITVYPNPVNNHLTIKTNLSTKEKVTFAIYDLNGNLVKRIDNIKAVDEIIISRSDLISGDFIYKVFNSSKVFSTGRIKVN